MANRGLRAFKQLAHLLNDAPFALAPSPFIFVDAQVANRGLCAIAQAESLRYKLLGGLAVRRACYGVLRFIMESGAKGCEVVVSGKLRAARAKVRLAPFFMQIRPP